MNIDNNPESENQRYKWLVMTVVALTTIMCTLDASIVNIALPVIRAEFHVGITIVEWVVISYLLIITSSLMIFGRLADIAGRKLIFIIGIVIFTAGSMLCALAGDIYTLIFFRVFQGIGAACITANGSAIITEVFPAKQRGKALGMVGTTVAIGLSSGPVLGGIITDYFGWRYIFLFNLPIGVAALITAQKILRKSVRNQTVKFDFAGSALLTLILGIFLLGWAQWERWGVRTAGILSAVSIVMMVIFVKVENRSPFPAIDLRLFRDNRFTYANLAAFFNFAARFSVVFLFPFYLIDVRSFKVSTAGLMMTPVPLLMAVLALFAGALSDKIGTRYLTASGMLLITISLGMLAFVDPYTSIVYILTSLTISGIGCGLFGAPNTSTIMGSVPRRHLGIAGGMISLVRNLGMIIGVAWSGAMFAAMKGHGAEGVHEVDKIVPAFQACMKIAVVIAMLGVIASFKRGEMIRDTDNGLF
ncbi:MFS transporter [bacterium]|nr:MFS transporter [FCB group bacterium]MBL7190091.1 MFS transporter [bacterium]